MNQLSRAVAVDNITINKTALGKLQTVAGAVMQYTDTRYCVKSFTRDTSLSSGNQAITGVGFQGKYIELFMSNEDGIQGGWGFSDGPTPRSGGTYLTAGKYRGVSGDVSRFFYDVTNRMDTDLASFDADGFTLSHTKINSPSGIITFIAKVYR